MSVALMVGTIDIELLSSPLVEQSFPCIELFGQDRTGSIQHDSRGLAITDTVPEISQECAFILQ